MECSHIILHCDFEIKRKRVGVGPRLVRWWEDLRDSKWHRHLLDIWLILMPRLGFPGGSDGEEFTCNAGHLGSIHRLGRSPGEGNSYPLQYSGLENSMDCIVAKSRTQLSDLHLHFQFLQSFFQLMSLVHSRLWNEQIDLIFSSYFVLLIIIASFSFPWILLFSH